MKHVYSGHESFSCKTLWLKKGYDFINNKNNFNAPDAVVRLGVGKNMVSSIRFWMKAFGLTKNDKLMSIANYLFNSNEGKDPYVEDLGTLWLLHFLLVSTGEATLYNILFTQLQRERKTFDRQHLLSFVKRVMIEDGKQSQFNENTVKKDIGTLLLNYVIPQKNSTLDEYNSLLIDLNIIRVDADGKNYVFNISGKCQLPWQIFLYAILSLKGKDNTVDYDLLQKIGLIFCMNDIEVIEICKNLESHYSNEIKYSETAGIRQLQFINEISIERVLDEYYG